MKVADLEGFGSIRTRPSAQVHACRKEARCQKKYFSTFGLPESLLQLHRSPGTSRPQIPFLVARIRSVRWVLKLWGCAKPNLGTPLRNHDANQSEAFHILTRNLGLSLDAHPPNPWRFFPFGFASRAASRKRWHIQHGRRTDRSQCPCHIAVSTARVWAKVAQQLRPQQGGARIGPEALNSSSRLLNFVLLEEGSSNKQQVLASLGPILLGFIGFAD